MNKAPILFIDDNRNFVRACADLLQLNLAHHSGHLISIESLAALEIYLAMNGSDLPVLAIVDIWLHRDCEGGFKAVARLRQRYPNIYIVFLSAYLDEAAQTRIKDISRVAVIPKPVTVNALSTFLINKVADIRGQ